MEEGQKMQTNVCGYNLTSWEDEATTTTNSELVEQHERNVGDKHNYIPRALKVHTCSPKKYRIVAKKCEQLFNSGNVR